MDIKKFGRYKRKTHNRYSGIPDIEKRKVTTTITDANYNFCLENNIKFAWVLETKVNELRGLIVQGEDTREQLQEKVRKLAGRYQRLVRFMNKHLGEDNTQRILEEAESVGRMTEKLDKKGGN